MFAAAALFANVVVAAEIPLVSQLSGAQEVPAVQSAGKGQLLATLDTATSQLRWKVAYSGLSGPVTAGHFHGPAGKMDNAAVAVGFQGNMDSPITGEATLTPVQMGELMDGKWYVNLHTAMHPKGEIRGQVMPR
jgi:hypothetical protein